MVPLVYLIKGYCTPVVKLPAKLMVTTPRVVKLFATMGALPAPTKLVIATVLPAEVPRVRFVAVRVPATSTTERVAPSALVNEPAKTEPALMVVLFV